MRSGSCPDNRGSGAPGGRPCTEAARPLPALCGERRHACDPAAVCPARQPSSSQVKEDNSTGARREPEPKTAPGVGADQNRRCAGGPEGDGTHNVPGAQRGTERHRSGWAPACSLSIPNVASEFTDAQGASARRLSPHSTSSLSFSGPGPVTTSQAPSPHPLLRGLPGSCRWKGEPLGAKAPGLRQLACGSCEDVALGWTFRDDGSGLHGGRPVKGQCARGSDLS